jgi:hypothetical protein
MLKDNTHVPSMSISGSPNDLANFIQQMIMNPNGQMQQLQTAFEHGDNEYIVQTLLTTLQVYVNNPLLRQIIMQPGATINDLFDSINVGMAAMGYIMHHKQITHDELKNYIYYARMTPTGGLLRSNYHPIRLMEFMDVDEIPESFQKLYSDRDYLPNIMSVWDRGSADSLLLISFQKVNIHFDINAMMNETVNTTAEYADVLTEGITSLLEHIFSGLASTPAEDEDEEESDLD